MVSARTPVTYSAVWGKSVESIGSRVWSRDGRQLSNTLKSAYQPVSSVVTLSHCDIGHKATLVSVFICKGHQIASCLAVSPAGDVRYWPSIAYDGASIDECNILEWQEFEELVVLSSGNYLLMTTTYCLVQLDTATGRKANHRFAAD